MPPSPTLHSPRSRRDRCPGVFRPWQAADGGLVRLRLIGGRITGTALAAVSEVARRYGDDDVHLTRRANLQLRGLPVSSDGLSLEVVEAIEAAGLLPSRTHDLVRNVMVSPLSGRGGGRADLRPLAAELDRLLCADAALAALPGRFLFVLDDGRGDLVPRSCDLGVVVLDSGRAQIRVGSGWGPVVPLGVVPAELIRLARHFLVVRGEGEDAAWHLDELPEPLVPACEPDPLALVSSPPLPYGEVEGGTHVAVPEGVLGPEPAAQLSGHSELVVTPWHGVLVNGREDA